MHKEDHREGFLIKKESTLYKKTKISDFGFSQIREKKQILSDNPNANIIFKDLHKKKELSESVKESNEFLHEITEEIKKKERIKLEEFDLNWKESIIEEEKNKRKEPESKSKSFPFKLNLADKESPPREKDILVEKKKEKKSEDQDEILADLKKVDDHKISLLEKKLASENNENSNTEKKSFQIKKDSKYQNEKTNLTTEKNKDNIEVEESNKKNTEKKINDKLALEKIKNEQKNFDLEKIKKSSEEEGFNKGYIEGEKKGTDAVHQEASKLLESLEKNIIKSDKINQEYLEKNSKNFHTLTQAICEAILEKKYTIDPNDFTKLIEKAISESLIKKPNQIKINEKTYNLIKKSLTDNQDKIFLKDDSLADFEFLVESHEGNLKSNLKEIISSLLEKIETQEDISDENNQDEEANKESDQNDDKKPS